jgi:glycosyltransferase involved in cell wall biosynthesis
MVQYIESKGISSNKITLATNFSLLDTIDSKLYADKNLLNKNYILYSGSFGYVNDIYRILALAKEYYKFDPHLFFVLIGNGSDFQGITDLVSTDNILSKNTIILDYVSKDKMPFYYINAKAGLLSFLQHGMSSNSSNKFFDYLNFGKPVITNFSGWQATLLDKYNAGICIENTGLPDVYRLYRYLNSNELSQNGINAKFLSNAFFDPQLTLNSLHLKINSISLNKK